MPQGCGTGEKGAETPHRVLAADAGGEGATGGLVDQEAGELVGSHDTVFSYGVLQRIIGKGNGHQEALI